MDNFQIRRPVVVNRKGNIIRPKPIDCDTGFSSTRYSTANSYITEGATKYNQHRPGHDNYTPRSIGPIAPDYEIEEEQSTSNKTFGTVLGPTADESILVGLKAFWDMMRGRVAGHQEYQENDNVSEEEMSDYFSLHSQERQKKMRYETVLMTSVAPSISPREKNQYSESFIVTKSEGTNVEIPQQNQTTDCASITPIIPKQLQTDSIVAIRGPQTQTSTITQVFQVPTTETNEKIQKQIEMYHSSSDESCKNSKISYETVEERVKSLSKPKKLPQNENVSSKKEMSEQISSVISYEILKTISNEEILERMPQEKYKPIPTNIYEQMPMEVYEKIPRKLYKKIPREKYEKIPSQQKETTNARLQENFEIISDNISKQVYEEMPQKLTRTKLKNTPRKISEIPQEIYEELPETKPQDTFAKISEKTSRQTRENISNKERIKIHEKIPKEIKEPRDIPENAHDDKISKNLTNSIKNDTTNETTVMCCNCPEYKKTPRSCISKRPYPKPFRYRAPQSSNTCHCSSETNSSIPRCKKLTVSSTVACFDVSECTCEIESSTSSISDCHCKSRTAKSKKDKNGETSCSCSVQTSPTSANDKESSISNSPTSSVEDVTSEQPSGESLSGPPPTKPEKDKQKQEPSLNDSVCQCPDCNCKCKRPKTDACCCAKEKAKSVSKKFVVDQSCSAITPQSTTIGSTNCSCCNLIAQSKQRHLNRGDSRCNCGKVKESKIKCFCRPGNKRVDSGDCCSCTSQRRLKQKNTESDFGKYSCSSSCCWPPPSENKCCRFTRTTERNTQYNPPRKNRRSEYSSSHFALCSYTQGEPSYKFLNYKNAGCDGCCRICKIPTSQNDSCECVSSQDDSCSYQFFDFRNAGCSQLNCACSEKSTSKKTPCKCPSEEPSSGMLNYRDISCDGMCNSAPSCCSRKPSCAKSTRFDNCPGRSNSTKCLGNRISASQVRCRVVPPCKPCHPEPQERKSCECPTPEPKPSHYSDEEPPVHQINEAVSGDQFLEKSPSKSTVKSANKESRGSDAQKSLAGSQTREKSVSLINTPTVEVPTTDNVDALEVRFAITKITKFNEFTTFEVMKSTSKTPKTMPKSVEGIFVLKKSNE